MVKARKGRGQKKSDEGFQSTPLPARARGTEPSFLPTDASQLRHMPADQNSHKVKREVVPVRLLLGRDDERGLVRRKEECGGSELGLSNWGGAREG